MPSDRHLKPKLILTFASSFKIWNFLVGDVDVSLAG